MSSLLAIIGYPIGHSISPAIYNATLPAMGIDARYEAWSTPPDEVAAAIEKLRLPRLLGMNVTVPHKSAVIPFLDAVNPMAARIGAVNCIVKEDGRLVGHNTDRYGFLRSLREAGCEPAGLDVLLLGNGGAARAVAYGLLEAGIASLTVAGRSPERVGAFVASIRDAGDGVALASTGWTEEELGPSARRAGLIVNSTSVGMRHSETEGSSPLPAALIPAGAWCYDLVYTPAETRFLSDARDAGAWPIGGLEMLVYQAAESVRLWTGREPPIDIMRKAAQTALGQATGDGH